MTADILGRTGRRAAQTELREFRGRKASTHRTLSPGAPLGSPCLVTGRCGRWGHQGSVLPLLGLNRRAVLLLSLHHSLSSASACVPHAPTASAVLEPTWSILPKSALSHSRWEARNWPGWENLHHRNWPTTNQDSSQPENC